MSMYGAKFWKDSSNSATWWRKNYHDMLSRFNTMPECDAAIEVTSKLTQVHHRGTTWFNGEHAGSCYRSI